MTPLDLGEALARMFRQRLLQISEAHGGATLPKEWQKEWQDTDGRYRALWAELGAEAQRLAAVPDPVDPDGDSQEPDDFEQPTLEDYEPVAHEQPIEVEIRDNPLDFDNRMGSV